MNIEELREYCLSKKGASESFPFDETTLVFKVCNKMFALTDLEGELFVSLKCEPERALELREEYSCVIPAFHMNKKHWNGVILESDISDLVVKEWIDLSYKLVVSKFPKKIREELKSK